MQYRVMMMVLVCMTTMAEVKIVPQPKELRDQGRECRLATAADKAVIVLGAQAGDTERAAAERLQKLVLRRFKIQLEIAGEADASLGQKQQILLGLPSTHARLTAALASKSVSFSAEALGPDGYLLEMMPASGGDTVIIAGGGARGVLYGQEVFFDLLGRRGTEIVFPAVSVRDWPSIPWRGWPHFVLAHHLEPGAMDAYVRARLNFTDVRDNPQHMKDSLVAKARSALMGCPAGIPIDKEPMGQFIANAHRHGFFVYGTVACAVTPERYEQVLGTYRELLALGVDGLWISFDDSGTGSSPCEVIRRVLALGVEHGISGRAIAITPPNKEYKTIDRPLNREMAAVPGMADATWFFTRVPCAADVAMARDIGLQRPPCWWHNLVSVGSGFTHSGQIFAPLREGSLPGYLELQPLSSGWGRPAYDAIREAATQTDTVMLWGLSWGYPIEYELTALGYWAWDPQSHNWEDTRTAIYRHMYGPSGVADARFFDDQMKELKNYFQLPGGRNFYESPLWPWRLKRLESREKVLKHISEMEGPCQRLAHFARQESVLDQARLERYYLEPMAASIRIARAMATADYPEYTQMAFESRMLDLLEAGETQEAQKTLSAAQAATLPKVDEIRVQLDGLKALKPYVEKWRARLSGLDYWQKFLKQRTTEMRKLFSQQMRRPVPELLPYLATASKQDWQAIFEEYDRRPTGEVLKSFAADEWLKHPSAWRGRWGIGLYTNSATRTTALVFPNNTPSAVGDYAEVAALIPMPAFKRRLVLDVFVQDSRRDNQYKGYRFLQLWVNQTLVWSEDIAQDRTGRAWVSIDISKVVQPGAELRLRFRVEDRKTVGNHLTVAFIGPFQLREE
ncbi:MAG: glycoside hydrolase family 20 zincin-like fold domain-containing protein [Kiritimatiellia bacterium]